MDAQITEWLEGNARRVVDSQLGEAARIDAKARELLGFIGIVLALLGATASQSGPVGGVWGGFYYAASVGAAALLIGAGLRAVQEVVEPPPFSDIGATAVDEYRNDPMLATMQLEEIQARAFNDLSEAAGQNAALIVGAQERLAAAYGVFAVALGFSGIAIVSLVVSLV